jgi:imidazolonepropionase-like amidohydrolase
MASGMVSLKRPGKITYGGFDAAELAFIVEVAEGHGLPVMAHANGEEAIMGAAKGGVRSVEHGYFMTPAALELMEKNGVHWVPTYRGDRRGALVRR